MATKEELDAQARRSRAAADRRKRPYYVGVHIVSLALFLIMLAFHVSFIWALGITLFVWLYQLAKVDGTPYGL